MKKTNIIKLAAAILGFVAVSCTGNFEDINKKPHRPEYVDAKQMIPVMMSNLISQQENDSQMIDMMIGMEYGGYASANTVWNGSGAFATLNPRQGWYGSMYGTLFEKTYSSWGIINDGTQGVGVIYHMAQILRVGTMLKVTDTYGPIPYSQVNGRDVAVAYDDQKTVYLTMLDHLEAAIDAIQAYLADPKADLSILDGNDISTYNGDLSKWAKYANSLRLRMAIRMSTNTDSETKQLAKTIAERAVSHPAGLIETNADNLVLKLSVENPYSKATDWNEGELRMNASIISYMNGYEDPRRAAYFTTVSGRYVGLRSGMANPGTPYTNTVSKIHLKDGEMTPLLVMCAAEVAFLKAEGAMLGWEMGDTAENFYNQGITLSFQQHEASGADSYMNNSSLTPAGHTDAVNSSLSAAARSTVTIRWANDGHELERLMVQKWIAMFPYGFEAWCDIRRTGYPVLFPAADNLSEGKVDSARGMRRVPFSRNEFNTNTANVEAAVALLGGPDTGGTDVWWAKKN